MERDCLIRGIHSGLGLRTVWAETAGTVNAGITIHDTDPAAAAALAEALGAAAAAAAMLDDGEKFSIRFDYPGTLRGLLLESAADGQLRGLVFVPHPLENGSGETTELYGDRDGQISVTRSDANGRILNSGQTSAPLANPSDDLGFYFSVSDQIETEIRTWIDFQANPAAPVRAMSVLFLQALPDCDLEQFSKLRNILHSPEVNNLRKNFAPDLSLELRLQQTLELLAKKSGISDFDPEAFHLEAGAIPHWQCRCSQSMMHRALSVLGSAELEKLFAEKSEPKIQCQFCRKQYTFRKTDFFADSERSASYEHHADQDNL